MTDKMTDQEVLALIQSDTPLARARAVFSGEYGRIEQASQQRSLPTIFDVRRMELDAVRKIAKALGIDL